MQAYFEKLEDRDEQQEEDGIPCDHPCWLFAVCPPRLFYACLFSFAVVHKVGLYSLCHFIISCLI